MEQDWPFSGVAFVALVKFLAAFSSVRVLVIDVGGTHVKFRVSTEAEVQRFKSGPTLTPETLIERMKARVPDSAFDVVSIGYPGASAQGVPIGEPGNLAPGWLGYDFSTAFGRPVRLVNDAVLQALGAYRSGRMLFLGLGTGVGSALVSEHVLIPLELGCLPHPAGGTLFDHWGRAGRKRRGHDEWQRDVVDLTPRLCEALAADYVLLGGGNGRKIDPLPPATFRGSADDAFEGGVRLWQEFIEPHDAEPARNWRVVR